MAFRHYQFSKFLVLHRLNAQTLFFSVHKHSATFNTSKILTKVVSFLYFHQPKSILCQPNKHMMIQPKSILCQPNKHMTILDIPMIDFHQINHQQQIYN